MKRIQILIFLIFCFTSFNFVFAQKPITMDSAITIITSALKRSMLMHGGKQEEYILTLGKTFLYQEEDTTIVNSGENALMQIKNNYVFKKGDFGKIITGTTYFELLNEVLYEVDPAFETAEILLKNGMKERTDSTIVSIIKDDIFLVQRIGSTLKIKGTIEKQLFVIIVTRNTEGVSYLYESGVEKLSLGYNQYNKLIKNLNSFLREVTEK